MFISILCVFRAAMYQSSGELIVSILYLVYVTLYRRPSGVQVWMPVTYTRCCSDTIISPDDGHMAALNMQRIEINIHQKEMCAKLIIYKDYTEMHGQQNIKLRAKFKYEGLPNCQLLCSYISTLIIVGSIQTSLTFTNLKITYKRQDTINVRL